MIFINHGTLRSVDKLLSMSGIKNSKPIEINIIVNLIYTNEGVIPGAKSCPNTQATFDVERDIIFGING